MNDVYKLDNINCFAQLIPLDHNQWVIILDLLLQRMYTDPSVKYDVHWLYSVFCSVATASTQHSVITVGCRETSAIVQHFFPWKRLVESRYGLDTRLALLSGLQFDCLKATWLFCDSCSCPGLTKGMSVLEINCIQISYTTGQHNILLTDNLAVILGRPAPLKLATWINNLNRKRWQSGMEPELDATVLGRLSEPATK